MTGNEQKNANRFSFLSLKTILANAGLDAFLGLLLGMIVLAYFFPQPGIAEEPISLEEITNYGFLFIFFFYGLRLSFPELKRGLNNWKLHIAVQLTTFLFFPLVLLLSKPFFGGTTQAELLWLGTFYLAALPSTVSSSVVMVAIAGGNLPAAIFNATISSLLGIFITPVWMSLFLASNTQNFDIKQVIFKLALQVLLPFVLGVALNSKFGEFANRHKKKLRYFDQTVILLIVYTAFCHSFTLGVFNDFSFSSIFLLMLAMSVLFFASYAFIYFISRILKFDTPDTVTILFCGSKKSLVQGTVMSKVLFPDPAIVGIVLLPIMVYHALQLIFASIIAKRIAVRTGTVAASE